MSGSTPVSEPKPLIGAIRWDAYNAPAGNIYGQAAISPLLTPSNNDRLPWFTSENSAGTLTVDGDSQAVIDTEIQEAAAAGINYFAFNYYPQSSGLQTALDDYLSSQYNNLLDFTIIDNPGWGATLGDYTTILAPEVKLLEQPNYQRTADGRPIYYLLMPDPTTFQTWLTDNWGGSIANMAMALNWLRSQVTAATGANPYVVLMPDGLNDATQIAAALGVDALSSYTASGEDTPGTAYSTLSAEAEGDWSTESSQTGLSLIPTVVTGWNPVASPGYQAGTPTQIANQVTDAIAWSQANPDINTANSVLIYSWNEFGEGGSTLDPTYQPGNPSGNASILNAVGTVLNATITSIRVQQDGETITVDSNGVERLYNASATLTEEIFSSGSYNVFASDGTEYRYSTTGALVEEDDPDGSKWYIDSAGDTLFLAPNSDGAVTLQKELFPDGSYVNFEGPWGDDTQEFYSATGTLQEILNTDGSKTIYNSDGSTEDFNNAGTLVSTFLANGDTLIPWSDGQLWYDPTGAFLAHEVDSTDGTRSFYGANECLDESISPTGTITEYNSLGNIVSTTSNGDTIAPWYNGALWYDSAGNYLGHELVGPNGFNDFFNATGDLQETDNPDGSKTIYQADGSFLSYNNTGTLVSTHLASGDTLVPWTTGTMWYDPNGNFIAHEVDDTTGTREFYATAGYLEETVTTGGTITQYNSVGQIVSATANGDTTLPWIDGELWYDDAGNYLGHQVVAPNGTNSFYNASGVLQALDNPDGSSVVLGAGPSAITPAALGLPATMAFVSSAATTSNIEVLSGGLGNDVLTAGTLAAELFGAGGSNVFAFVSGSAGSTYIIEDLVPGVDHILLSGYGQHFVSTAVQGGGINLSLPDGSFILVDPGNAEVTNIAQLGLQFKN